MRCMGVGRLWSGECILERGVRFVRRERVGGWSTAKGQNLDVQHFHARVVHQRLQHELYDCWLGARWDISL